MLCGILEPTEGGGHACSASTSRREPERIKSVIGYMSQKFSLYDDLTVDENLTFYARVYEVPRAPRAAADRADGPAGGPGGREGQLAGTLSGGYRQRLALACALVHAPRLIFLDEPTAGVDPVSRRNFWGLIRRLADQGTTILVTTHYMDEAELCDTLGFIYQGKLIAQGPPAVIKSETFRRPVIEVEVAEPAPRLDLLADWDGGRGGAAGGHAASGGAGPARPRRRGRRGPRARRARRALGPARSSPRSRTSSSPSWTRSARRGCASSSGALETAVAWARGSSASSSKEFIHLRRDVLALVAGARGAGGDAVHLRLGHQHRRQARAHRRLRAVGQRRGAELPGGHGQNSQYFDVRYRASSHTS